MCLIKFRSHKVENNRSAGSKSSFNYSFNLLKDKKTFIKNSFFRKLVLSSLFKAAVCNLYKIDSFNI